MTNLSPGILTDLSWKICKLAFKIIYSSTVLLPAWDTAFQEAGLAVRKILWDVATHWNLSFNMMDFVVIYWAPVNLITNKRSLGLGKYALDEHSVLKSSPRTRKGPATGLDHNWFGPDCSCSPGGVSISLVAVVEGWVKLKDQLWTGCNQSFKWLVVGLWLVTYYLTTPCFAQNKDSQYVCPKCLKVVEKPVVSCKSRE